jgi:exportin-1
VVDIFIEIASLPVDEIPESYYPRLQELLMNFIQSLMVVVPKDVNLPVLFQSGTEEDQLFVSRLALFLGTFLRSHLKLFQVPGRKDLEEVLLISLHYLLMISEVDDEEIFKTCLEFWHHFAKEQYTTDTNYKTTATGQLLGGSYNRIFGDSSSPNGSGPLADYAEVHSRLRNVLIDRMAKPEEVIIVEDDNGEIIREVTKDTGT